MSQLQDDREVYEMTAQSSAVELVDAAPVLQPEQTNGPSPPPADLVPAHSSQAQATCALDSSPNKSQSELSSSVPNTPSVYPPAHPSAMPSKAAPSPLSRTDIRGDRILRNLALAKGIPLESPVVIKTFRARAAPSMGRPSVPNGAGAGAGGVGFGEGNGPRLNKAAALRLGIKWEEPKASRPSGVLMAAPAVTAQRTIKPEAPIASLAQPSLAPRANRASVLRAGGGVSTLTKSRDLEANIALAKERADAEKARKRASIALPASLTAPNIQPRLNRASQLRAGMPPLVTAAPRQSIALNETHLNHQPTQLSRRASVAGPVKSLAPPTIAPRLNKTVMLRTQSRPSAPSGPTEVQAKQARPVSVGARPPTATSSSNSFARPTKASLLRASAIGRSRA